MTSRAAADHPIKDDHWAVTQFSSVWPPGSRRPNYIANHVSLGVRASSSERSPTAINDGDASDLDRLAASLDAIAFCYIELDVDEVGYGDGTRVEPLGEVVAMSTHSFLPPGVFEPEAVAAMSEAFEAACEVLQDTGEPQALREIIAKRIVAAATVGERDPVRLLAAALVERQIS
jgi:hypothetical protein